MDVKGVAKAIKAVQAVQNEISAQIDDLDQDAAGWSEKDQTLNELWDCAESAIDNLIAIRDE